MARLREINEQAVINSLDSNLGFYSKCVWIHMSTITPTPLSWNNMELEH